MNEREYDFSGVDEMVRKTFSERLKNIRIKSKLSQAQFADMLGISVAALSYYERGERIPDIIFLYKVQECFLIPDGYLLGNTNSLIKEYTDISNELSLSDKAVDRIKKYADENDYFDFENYNNNILSRLLESDELYSVINLIAWTGFESYSTFPDKEYIDYIAMTKLKSLITSIREEICCDVKIEPVSDNQATQKDYSEWLMEKISSKNFNSEVNMKYSEMEEEHRKEIEALHEEYKQSNRYKALQNLKDLDNNENNKSEEG